MALSDRVKQLRDVLILARKPDRKEFSFTLKISVIGILLIGGIAFFIQLIMSFLMAT
jgi:protein translocase SEC61 complex gamma subunit